MVKSVRKSVSTKGPNENAYLNGNGNKNGVYKKQDGEVNLPNGLAGFDTERTQYMYRGLSSLLQKEYSDKGSPYSEYYTGPNNEVVSRKMFGLHGLINPAKEPALDTNGGLMYHLYNGRNTVSELTDRHGDIIESYRYEAFGALFEGITAPYNTTSYTGHHYDDIAGLMDMKARWYDPLTAQFTSADSWPGTLDQPYTQNRYAYVGNNPINMWDPTGHVPDWVGDSWHWEQIWTWDNDTTITEWNLQNHSLSYGPSMKENEIREDRQIIEFWSQSVDESWTYNVEKHHWIIGYGDDEDQEDISFYTETYSQTNLYTWQNAISAMQIAQGNRSYLESYGSPPANATPVFSVSRLNGEVISANILTDDNHPLTSMQSQIIKNSVNSILDKQAKDQLSSVKIASLSWDSIKSGIDKIDKGYHIAKGLGGFLVDNGFDELTFLFKKSTYVAIYDFGKALYNGEISLADIRSGLKEMFIEEYIDPYVYLKNNTSHVIFGDPTDDEAYDYGYQLGKGINNAGEIAVSIVTAGTGSAVALAKLKPLLKSLSKLTKGTKNEGIIKDALEGAGNAELNITEKISKQVGKRGWTNDSIDSTINKPFTTRQATNKANGNDATAYFNKDGTYIVKDNVTNDIIQVSNRNDPHWVPDPTIINPYIPK